MLRHHASRWSGIAAGVAATVALCAPGTASANPVIEWNARAETAVIDVAGHPIGEAGIDFAMVHGAIYDAVNAIDGTPYEPYLAAPPADPSASKDAAVAAAARDVLVHLLPAQQSTLDAWYADSLAQVPDGPAEQAGVTIGQQAAATMIAARQNDGRYGPRVWNTTGSAPGDWHPLPAHNFGPPFLVDNSAWVGEMDPFLIPSPSSFRSDGPHALTSAEYAEDLNQVKSLGSSNSTTRTADQTAAARFWHGNPPPRQVFWPMVRQIAAQQGLTTSDAARMFGMVYLAGADAGIAIFDDKYHWNSWRPMEAIREADTDGNPATDADPTWTPLVFTAPFPEHVSGHVAYTSVVTRILEAFLGTDKVTFSATVNLFPNTSITRSFDKLSEARREVIGARVWAGVHFRTGNIEGDWMGKDIADYVLANHFQPTGN